MVACRDGPTEPTPLATPVGGPELTLIGGTGTSIFPLVAPGNPQPYGVAIGLNSSGQVTGAFRVGSDDHHTKAYRWTPGGAPVNLPGCCDEREFGVDINDAGVVVGSEKLESPSGLRAVVATGTDLYLLPMLPGAPASGNAQAFAVNNAGQVVGVSPTGAGAYHAVLWSPARWIHDLGTLGGNGSRAIDINDAGQVIGMSGIAGDAASHAFLWSSGTGMQDLNTLLGATITSVLEINDAGQIVGTYTASGGQSHAFRYTPGSGLLDLGTLGGTSSEPTGLNSRGEVVGSSTLAGGGTHAFLWTPSDGMEDVTALTGVAEIRRLNDNLQTLTVTAPPTGTPTLGTQIPRLVQLEVTESDSPPIAAFTWSCNGLTCTLDASNSIDDKPGLTYSWDLNKFPDGSATGKLVTVTYPHVSTRTVTLTVTDSKGQSSTSSQTFNVDEPQNSPPIASFTFTCTDLTCSFDATGSTDDKGIVSYVWDLNKFPDGSATGATATTTYPHSGVRYVTLTVTDAEGASNSITRAFEPSVNTADAAPVARFTSSCSGTVCTFDASTSTDDVGITSYVWSLGKYPDNDATGVTVTTDYWHTSTRTVTLTVTDTKGQTNSVTKTITIP
jgi:probable HAF family extracellular repeat protein